MYGRAQAGADGWVRANTKQAQAHLIFFSNVQAPARARLLLSTLEPWRYSRISVPHACLQFKAFFTIRPRDRILICLNATYLI